MVKPHKPIDVYVRVSRVGAREHLISPDEQERRARELARQHGLTVGEVFEDLDESGGKLDRPGLQRVLERVERGVSGGVIVAWLDRLSRDSEHAHALVRRITEAGGHIYAPDAPSDWTTPEGELQAGILFEFAAYVRKRARAGFERAKEHAIARGIPVHTRPAVGYRVKADGSRRLEPDPDVAPVVREVFERRARGEGPAALGRYLEEQGVATSQGSHTWSKQAIYGLLRNRIHLGELHYGRDNRYVNTESHEPIVDVATWTAAQHPNGTRLAPPRTHESAFLVTGLLRCRACRYAMQATTTSRRKRIYRCTRTHAAGVCPAPVRVSAEDVEAAAVAAFWTLTDDLEARGTYDASGDLAALKRAFDRADRALREWASPEVQEAIGDLAEYAAGLRTRRDERDQAAAELGRAQAAGIRRAPSARRLRADWRKMTTQERRELLATRFDCLALGRDRELVVYPRGAGPTDLPRRGFKRAPVLAPFPDPPDDARLVTL